MSAMIAFLSLIASRRVMALDSIHENDLYKSFAAMVQGHNCVDSCDSLEIPLFGTFEVMAPTTAIV
jgi:hypothetical protein